MFPWGGRLCEDDGGCQVCRVVTPHYSSLPASSPSTNCYSTTRSSICPLSVDSPGCTSLAAAFFSFWDSIQWDGPWVPAWCSRTGYGDPLERTNPVEDDTLDVLEPSLRGGWRFECRSLDCPPTVTMPFKFSAGMLCEQKYHFTTVGAGHCDV